MATKLQSVTQRRRRRSAQVAPVEPHALQRRGSTRFHPLSQSHVFGLADVENGFPSIVDDNPHHGHVNAIYSSTPKAQRLQLQGYTIVGGWTTGPDGRATYIEHGRIEEVNDNDDSNNDYDASDDSDDNDDDDLNDEENNSFFLNPLKEIPDFNMTTPRVLSSLSNSNLAPIRAEGAGRGLNGFGTVPITEPLPPSTTPPPCPPRLRRVKPQLFPSAASSAIAMGPRRPNVPIPPPAANGHPIPFTNTTNSNNNSIHTVLRPKAPTPTAKSQATQNTVLDIATEIALLDENSDLLHRVFRDMQILHTLFYAQSPVDTYVEHIQCCAGFAEPVNRIMDVLNTRRNLGEEEWNVKTEAWHQKYAQRLYSLRRTLIRLRNVRRTLEKPLERRRMKPHHITLVLEKLKHHLAKLENLAFKFVSSFERIRIRHIHWLLVQAHEQAKERQRARQEDEVSFEKAWFEDKTVRDGLRKEFFEAQEHRTRMKQIKRL